MVCRECGSQKLELLHEDTDEKGSLLRRVRCNSCKAEYDEYLYVVNRR